ncbi:MAG: endo alpha-1,4 polygalactosaminidase [archaeon]|nr:endo alpha-1,4 polygalactosaminidase [archaeon]
MNLKRYNLVVALIFLLIIAGCSSDNISDTLSDNPDEIVSNNNNNNNRDILFHYQLQGANFEDLKNLGAQYLVIDVDDADLTVGEMEELKKLSVVLSYLSIGEAEDYRDYWQEDWKVGKPSFIDEENPQWAGNYKVKYWDPQWQEIILNKVKEIKSLGYDGVYLDIIDAYEYYNAKEVLDAKEKMIDFVARIKSESGLLVFPQNAVELYESDKYKRIVDGFGAEDTWYDDNNLQEEDYTLSVLSYLREARDDGKVILSIDYPSEKPKVCDFYTKCNNEEFLCTVSNRNLDFSHPVEC